MLTAIPLAACIVKVNKKRKIIGQELISSKSSFEGLSTGWEQNFSHKIVLN